jgi:hypothetical protein
LPLHKPFNAGRKPITASSAGGYWLKKAEDGLVATTRASIVAQPITKPYLAAVAAVQAVRLYTEEASTELGASHGSPDRSRAKRAYASVGIERPLGHPPMMSQFKRNVKPQELVAGAR